MNLARHLAPFIGLAVIPALACAHPQSPAPPPDLPRTHEPRATTAAITQQDLMTRVYIFADDSMMGRATGSPGFARATAYIARELERLGLQPVGDSGTFFQRVPFASRGISDSSTLSVGGQTLTLWDDFAPVAGRGTPRPVDGAIAVYGGVLGDTARLTAEQAAGKVVVYRADGAVRGMPRIGAADPVAGAAAVFIIGLETLSPGFRDAMRTPSVGLAAGAQNAAQVPSIVFITSDAAAQLMGPDWNTLEVGAQGIAVQGRIALSEEALPSHNVVALLPGSDPGLRNQYVAIGAHSDHVGYNRAPVNHDSLRLYNREEWVRRGAYAGTPPLTPAQLASIAVNVDSLEAVRPARPDSIYNGADDDGSGSMAVLEVAEAMAMAERKPARSVLFVWHAGEERGLLGSRYLSENSPVPRDSIVAQINIDMIGRGGNAQDVRGGGPDYLGVIGASRLSSELGELVREVNQDQARPLDLDYGLDADGHPENIYCRSDHYNYARWGIPVVFFFTGLHGDYHQVTDEPQYLDYPHYTRIARYIHDVTRGLANLPARPAVDGERPDPNAVCRQ